MVYVEKLAGKIREKLRHPPGGKQDLSRPAQVIGVAGTEKGVGVTHFCLMAANYLTCVAGEQTAVLEWNEDGDFIKLEKICKGQIEEKKPYHILGTSYYKNADMEELSQCLERYSYILIDFGVIGVSNRTEFQCCKKRVLVGSFSEWQWETFWEFLKQEGISGRKWIYAAAFGSRETRKEVRRKLGIPVLEIPFSADAFSVTPGTLEFFQKFFS